MLLSVVLSILAMVNFHTMLCIYSRAVVPTGAMVLAWPLSWFWQRLSSGRWPWKGSAIALTPLEMYLSRWTTVSVICWCSICPRRSSIKRLRDTESRQDPSRPVAVFYQESLSGRYTRTDRTCDKISRSTTRRWAHAWNDGGVNGIRLRFGGGRAPKITSDLWDELCASL